MRILVVALVLLFGGMVLPQAAHAADPPSLRYSRPAALSLPFPRGEQAQAVWASDACLRNCESYCAWDMAACLNQVPQGLCLRETDRCDRYCQSQCRSAGGPLLPLID